MIGSSLSRGLLAARAACFSVYDHSNTTLRPVRSPPPQLPAWTVFFSRNVLLNRFQPMDRVARPPIFIFLSSWSVFRQATPFFYHHVRQAFFWYRGGPVRRGQKTFSLQKSIILIKKCQLLVRFTPLHLGAFLDSRPPSFIIMSVSKMPVAPRKKHACGPLLSHGKASFGRHRQTDRQAGRQASRRALLTCNTALFFDVRQDIRYPADIRA